MLLRFAKISKKSIGIVPTMWLLMAVGLASTLLAGTLLLRNKTKRFPWTEDNATGLVSICWIL